MQTPVSPNEGLAAVNIDSRRLAVELAVGPLTAHRLAKGVEWFTRCDISDLHAPAIQMLGTWARIGQMNGPMVRA